MFLMLVWLAHQLLVGNPLLRFMPWSSQVFSLTDFVAEVYSICGALGQGQDRTGLQQGVWEQPTGDADYDHFRCTSEDKKMGANSGWCYHPDFVFTVESVTTSKVGAPGFKKWIINSRLPFLLFQRKSFTFGMVCYLLTFGQSLTKNGWPTKDNPSKYQHASVL